MGSPVVQDDFPELASTADVCTRLSQLLTLWSRFGTFLGWLLNSDGEISDDVLAGISDRTLPVGAVIMYGSHSPPSDKWMICAGQAINRADYEDLFNRIGTSFGIGDGTTTFNLPDFRDRCPVGAGTTYSAGTKGGAASAEVDLSHYHGVGKAQTNDNVNLVARGWSLTDTGATATVSISGDDVENTGTDALTTGDIATTTEIPSLKETTIPTVSPFQAIPFIIKVK